jgi:hypothetical protein
MRIAVARTMARANTICNTAREIGVAMCLARANPDIKSSQKTAPPAVPVAIKTAPAKSGGRGL